MSGFKREARYYVIKMKDLTEEQDITLCDCLSGNMIPCTDAVVVEKDWPNYEHVWKTVEKVAAGTWQASRQALESHGPVAIVEHLDYLTFDDNPRRKAVKELFEGALVIGDKLYTHPASADNAKDSVVMQAQIWAQEARTQKAIVKQIGEIVGCANDWEMVGAVRNALSNASAVPCRFHDLDTEACEQFSGQVPCEPHPASAVPKGWTIERFVNGLGVKGIDVRWPGKRGGVHIRKDDPHNTIAHNALHDLAQDLICGSQRSDRPALGQRKAAQVGKTIGVLVQNQDGEVAAVTDLGRCTWLSQDMTGAGDAAGLQETANKVCRHLPENMVLSLCMENGAAWVELGVDRIGNVELPDFADKTLIDQINDALCVANGWTGDLVKQEQGQ
jgi:hypothetical protein